MTGEVLSRATLQAAWDADFAYTSSPQRFARFDHVQPAVPQAQLQRLLEGAAPVIRAEDRARLRRQAKDAAIQCRIPAGVPGAMGTTWGDAVPLHTLLNLLDADPPEEPVPDLNEGRDGYPPARSYTIILGATRGSLTITATSCREDDEWLILDNAGTTAGKFRLGEIGGYYQNATGGVVAEGAA